MRARWTELMERFAALSLRERILVMVAVFAVAYQLADLVILDRQYETMQRLATEIARDRRAIARGGQETAMLAARAPQDPNMRLRNEIGQARHALDDLQARLHQVANELISPQDMVHFLEELLIQESELTLLRLHTLDVKPLIEPAGGDEGRGAQPALHRHGFAVEFAGGYLATLRYLQALEALPWRFFWDSVQYEVIDYPHSVVRLKLHTLGLSEDWIGV